MSCSPAGFAVLDGEGVLPAAEANPHTIPELCGAGFSLGQQLLG
jgi:hypothetical protein